MANSDQTIETPIAFVKAVEKLFEIEFLYDMAASLYNKKAPVYYTEEDNSLSIDWPLDGWVWLNPPFKNVGAWVKKCQEQMERGCKIISIWPLSGDLNMIPMWKSSNVFIIHGRLWPEVRGIVLCQWLKNDNMPPMGLRWNRKAGTLTDEWDTFWSIP